MDQDPPGVACRWQTVSAPVVPGLLLRAVRHHEGEDRHLSRSGRCSRSSGPWPSPRTSASSSARC